MVIEKNRNSTACSHVEFTGRGHEPGNKTKKVAKEDKKPDSADHRQVFLSLFSDDIHKEVLEKIDDEFDEDLAFRGDDLEFPCGKTQEKDERHCHKQAHDDIIRDEMFWIMDLDPDKREEISQRFPDDFVEEFDQEITVF